MTSASESPLDPVDRELFGRYVQWVVGDSALHASIATSLGLALADLQMRFAGAIDFTASELDAVVALLHTFPLHRINMADFAGTLLSDVQRALASDPYGSVAKAIRQRVDGSSTNLVPDDGEIAVAASSETDVKARALGLLKDPRRGRVVMPSLVAGVIVGVPWMTRTKAFRESAGLDGKVMFAIALGLWVGLNVLALDAIMRWTLLHVVRRVKRIRMVYELFDTTVAARRRVDPRQVAIRTWAVGQLERSEDRKAVMFRLSWAEACERLAVWCFVAAVAVSPLVSRHPIWSIMGVVCLVTVLPLLFLVATIDQVRTAQERWKSSKLRFG